MNAVMLIIGLVMGYWLSSGECAELSTMLWALFTSPIALGGGIVFAILVILLVFGIIGHILNGGNKQ